MNIFGDLTDSAVNKALRNLHAQDAAIPDSLTALRAAATAKTGPAATLPAASAENSTGKTLMFAAAAFAGYFFFFKKSKRRK